MSDSTNITTIKLNSFKNAPPIKHRLEKQYDNKACLCQSIAPLLFVAKIFGLLPISWKNVKGQCKFTKSYAWLSYAIVISSFYTVQLFISTDVLNFDKNKPLPELLSAINDIMYVIFVAILTVLNVARFPRFVQTFNSLIPVIKDAGLCCQSSLESLRKIQFGYMILFFGEIMIQMAVLIGLHYSDSYMTNFDYNIFVNVGIQNVPFVFYMIFFMSCSIFISILGCFEKLVINTLKFTPVHPLSDIDETNNKRDFIGLIKYEVCKQEHKSFGKMLLLSQPELVEYLRGLHEDISLAMYSINSCMNPQLLFHTVVELTVLIIHWYEVIVYTSYTFSSPLASTINFVNWMFVIAHSIGLFLFLKSAQDLKNMVHGLTNFLLEYSTRISNPDEHQQVRIFIEKLQQHRPITASGVFNIDLGIAGPISANILTYVLVALQFDVPKN
ncbi:hypothetical protein RN001_015103 [Aquatica leii]|uniref:Gustatory receptor n=1 Tax=Aquatica leii TaxID=1421715 RepID=A0AAN7SC72_9COLE|nr:hypothetical protein RN001_015103 [Aquatica leii]